MMMNNMLMLRGWLSNQQHYYHGAIERARLTLGCLATTRITTALRRGGLLCSAGEVRADRPADADDVPHNGHEMSLNSHSREWRYITVHAASDVSPAIVSARRPTADELNP